MAAFAAALALSAIAPVQPASAQSLFEAVFGGLDRAIRRELRMAPPAYSYSSPTGMFDDRRGHRSSSADYSGPSSGYCVRTCDGRYFPVKASGGMSAAELCKSFCPAAQTKVFGGSKIDYAVAGDGQRYADLDNAFLYRERKVDNCTCNGKDAFGLARLGTESDPTLRPGDIVATNEGLVTYNGSSKSAEFTPIEQTGGSSEWRRRLMAIKVTPAPPRQATPVPPLEETTGRSDRRRVQR